jgi:hypothetical protein
MRTYKKHKEISPRGYSPRQWILYNTFSKQSEPRKSLCVSIIEDLMKIYCVRPYMVSVDE